MRSENFQHTVSLTQFKDFLNKHPSLKNNMGLTFNNQWKIISITLNSTAVITNEKLNPIDSKNTSVFENKSALYSIHYTFHWKYKAISKGKVLFSDNTKNKHHFASVNIQSILTTKSDGHYSNILDFLKNMHQQINKLKYSTNISKGDAELPCNTNDYKGK